MCDGEGRYATRWEQYIARFNIAWAEYAFSFLFFSFIYPLKLIISFFSCFRFPYFLLGLVFLWLFLYCFHKHTPSLFSSCIYFFSLALLFAYFLLLEVCNILALSSFLIDAFYCWDLVVYCWVPEFEKEDWYRYYEWLQLSYSWKKKEWRSTRYLFTRANMGTD